MLALTLWNKNSLSASLMPHWTILVPLLNDGILGPSKGAPLATSRARLKTAYP